jgi:hypothetical protein
MILSPPGVTGKACRDFETWSATTRKGQPRSGVMTIMPLV